MVRSARRKHGPMKIRHSRPLMIASLIASAAIAPLDQAQEAAAPAGGGPVKGSPTVERISQRGRIVVGTAFRFLNLIARNQETGEREGFCVDISRALAKRLLGDENKVQYSYAGGVDNLGNLQ